jgi:hypothetical protein
MHQLGTFFWPPGFPIPLEGESPKEAIQMPGLLSWITAVPFLLGAALLSAPAFVTDVSDGDFGGTYGYIGPGVASLPGVDVEFGPVDQALTKEVQP